MARGAEFSFLAEERRIVDGEEHGHSGLVNSDGGQRLRVFEIANRIANFKTLQADDSANIAALNGISLLAAHSLEGVHLLNLYLFRCAVAVGDRYVHPFGNRTAVNAAHSNAARIIGIVERGDKHLRRPFKLLGRGNDFHDFVQQIVDILCGRVVVLTHPAVFCRAIDNGEIQLVLRCAKVAHEVEDHLVHLLGAAVGFIYLVDHYNGFEANLECLLQHETCLRHGALEGINEQNTSVRHIQHALHLATKVGVSRSVNDIDFRAFVVNGHVLGENRDTAFALQVVVVEDEFASVLVLAEEVAGHEHLVHERCLAVVHVCDNGNVANVLHI